MDKADPKQVYLSSRWVNTGDATLQRRRAYCTSLIEPAALRGGGFFWHRVFAWRGVRTPAGRDRWAPAQVSRLLFIGE